MTQIDTKEKDVLLATAIASGATASAAAKQLEMSLSTVQRRLSEPSFRRLVADLRGEMIASALGRMAERLTAATDTVAAMLESPEPHIRLRAARLLLGNVLRMHDAVDMQTRIHEIEAEIARRTGPLA